MFTHMSMIKVLQLLFDLKWTISTKMGDAIITSSLVIGIHATLLDYEYEKGNSTQDCQIGYEWYLL